MKALPIVIPKHFKLNVVPPKLNVRMNNLALLAEIEADAEEHIAFLRSFIRAPSPNPPGDTVAAAEVLCQYLQSRSIIPETRTATPLAPNILSDFICGSPAGPCLVLNGHIDVFPEGSSSDWARDPWSGDLVEGRIRGRGGVDMKTGTAASVIAYTYLYKYREHLEGSAGLCAVSDEETDGKFGSRWLLEKAGARWKGDVMINAEPSGLGTIRFAEKGTLRLTFTVRTEGAHGAYLHRSESAIRTAAKLIKRLGAVEEIVPDLDPALKEHMKQEDVRRAIDDAMGKGAAKITLKPTLNIGTIKGGLKVNMIPDICIFEADIRMPIGLVQEQVMDLIYSILTDIPQANVEIQQAASNPAAGCAHGHHMVDILARQAERVIGRKPVAIHSEFGGDGFPEGMASRDESVSAEEFLRVVRTHALAAWEYLGGEM